MDFLETQNEFEDFLKQDIGLVLFKSHGCGVCEAVKAQLETLLPNYPHLKSAYCYSDDLDKIRGQLLIFTAPTVILFIDGKEYLRESRFIDYKRITGVFDRYFS